MNFISKISSFTLALLVLLTSTGFSLHKHHCTVTNETVTSIVHEKSCCGKNDKQDCPKKCCQDQVKYIQLDTETSPPVSQHQLSPDLFVAVLHVILFELFEQHDLRRNKYLNYNIPPIIQDIPVLTQSFLI